MSLMWPGLDHPLQIDNLSLDINSSKAILHEIRHQHYSVASVETFHPLACLEMSHAVIGPLSTCLSFLFLFVRKCPFKLADNVDHWVLNYTVSAIDKDNHETICCIVLYSTLTFPVGRRKARV